MTDYRTELQRLVQAYDEHGGKWHDEDVQALHRAVEAARTALAQPELGGSTDEDIQRIALSLPATCDWSPEHTHWTKSWNVSLTGLLIFARAVISEMPTALAQPELEGVTDQEIDQLAWNWYSREGSTWWQREAWLSLARAVIAADRARWARPTIEPVPDTKARELLNLLLDDLDALIDSSEGVAGLHLNGDVASWESLCKGGRFETWLMRMDEARAFLDSTLEKSAIEPVPSAEME